MYDPTDPIGGLVFNVLAMVAETGHIRLRTRESLKVAKAKGCLRRRQANLNHRRAAHRVALGDPQLVDLLSTAQSNVPVPAQSGTD